MLKFAILLAAVAVCYGQSDSNQYRLFTKEFNPTSPVNITKDRYLPTEFTITDNTIFLIHGQGGSLTHAMNTLIKNEIFRQPESYNVIVVDWQRKASGGYSSARAQVRWVAEDLREFLRWLINADHDSPPTTTTPETNDPLRVDKPVRVDLTKVHLVGFGLGAHVAGIASRELALYRSTVGRITGLDPSGSGWDSRSERLRPGDAYYVEVIHTDGSGPLANGIGTALGKKDFFVNGGSNQPGCFSHSCSHNRAYELFAASMRGHLRGNGCSSMAQMNLNLCRGMIEQMGGTTLDKDSDFGIYRVNTGRTFPFTS